MRSRNLHPVVRISLAEKNYTKGNSEHNSSEEKSKKKFEKSAALSFCIFFLRFSLCLIDYRSLDVGFFVIIDPMSMIILILLFDKNISIYSEILRLMEASLAPSHPNLHHAASH